MKKNIHILSGYILLYFMLILFGWMESTSAQQIALPTNWRPPAEVQNIAFELGGDKGQFHAWGQGSPDKRVFFDEFLPALFERTLTLEKFELKDGSLEWIFTGPRGGFTVTLDSGTIKLEQRFYDSYAFNYINGPPIPRHPQWQLPVQQAPYTGTPKALAVRIDHKLNLSIALNGKEVFQTEYLGDISRHQLRSLGENSLVSGQLLTPLPAPAFVKVDPNRRYQTMIGFGGIATPTAYAQLSKKGKRRWWELLCEYNLLIQREYPNGARLNEKMDNWDKRTDATPHYYGDNFPNGEISDFAYIKTLRRLGGQVWFEFWELPPWVKNDPEKYAHAMVRYCQVCRQKTGAAPEIVGVQNEKNQITDMFHQMTLTLRRRLDEAGFPSVRIHMTDAGHLALGLKRAQAFRSSQKVWDTIDFSATHMYDYQEYFTNPDGFDDLLKKWKGLTKGKPFLSTELCVNYPKYQLDSYRPALLMGQLYHKNLVITDASALCYCWTILNVVQPSYGYTRSLFVPDRAAGFVPAPSSHQLRVFGSYSRYIRAGMVRIAAESNDNNLLVSAFAGADNTGTVVALNRSSLPRRMRITWPGMRFAEMEITDPYQQNEPCRSPSSDSDNNTEVIIEPGSLVTLTNVPLGRCPEELVTD